MQSRTGLPMDIAMMSMPSYHIYSYIYITINYIKTEGYFPSLAQDSAGLKHYHCTYHSGKEKILLRYVLLLFIALAASGARAATWPDRPVTLLVPSSAGSSLDVVGRLLAEQLKPIWNQTVIVENKPGAGGRIGMETVKRARPDGYTMILGFNGPVAFAPFLYKKISYDVQKDFAPVVLTTTQPNVLAVSGDLPVNNIREFIDWARKAGTSLNYASIGNGSSSHLTMELFKSMTGIKAQHIPFNGSPAAALSVANGETKMLFAVASGMTALVQSGKLKQLAVTSKQRLAQFPDLPTLEQAGLTGFEAMAWNGLLAPAGTPPDIIEKVNRDVNAVLAKPAILKQLEALGNLPGGGSTAAFARLIQDDQKKWGNIIGKLQIQID